MKHVGVFNYKLLFSALAVTALFVLLGIMPGKVSALSVASQTQQILPPGANTCVPIQITNVTPYVYDNALNSFEFTVSDASYVAVVGSIGNTSIPLRFMTRLPDASGGVRYHIDVDSTSVLGSTPVSITLLSARTGSPVCASVIATDFGSAPNSGTYTPPTYPSAPAPSTTYPTSHTPSSSTGSGNSGSASGAGMNMNTGTSAEATPTVVSLSTTPSPLKSICASPTSAYRLWLILLVLYALLVGGLLWLEFPMSWNWAQTPERVASAILVLLILLLGFWYLSVGCRAALWMPLLAFLIAILGLLAAFWNHPKMTQLLLIEETKKPIPMPPAKTTSVTTSTTTTTVKK